MFQKINVKFNKDFNLQGKSHTCRNVTFEQLTIGIPAGIDHACAFQCLCGVGGAYFETVGSR